jgi:hypothetical protein
MGLPIIPKSSDLISPAPIIIYTPAYGEDPSQGPQSWSENIAFPSQFRLIHDAKLLPGTNSGLDMVLVAGREGIALLWFNNASKKWEHRIVGSGLPREGDNPYWGSGSVDVVRVGDDPVGYIAACEVTTRQSFYGLAVILISWSRLSTAILSRYTPNHHTQPRVPRL